MAAIADNSDSGTVFRRRIAEKYFQQLEKEREEESVWRTEEKETPKSPYTIQNALWIIAAIAVFYYTDLPLAILYDPRIQRTWLNIGIVLIGANIGIASYLIVFLSWIKKIDSDDWEIKHPAAIPIATACFAFGSICITIGVWPIWGWFTPFILFTELMAVIVLISMLPSCI